MNGHHTEILLPVMILRCQLSSACHFASGHQISCESDRWRHSCDVIKIFKMVAIDVTNQLPVAVWQCCCTKDRISKCTELHKHILPIFVAIGNTVTEISRFLQRAQCSHCKHCISYGNSVRPSIRLSVCPSVCPSVTRRYCVKTTARSTMQLSPLDSKMCLVL